MSPAMTVEATVATDDGATKSTFNAAPWFAGDPHAEPPRPPATDGQIRVLAAYGWNGARCAIADDVAFACEEQPGVARVFEYIERERPKREDGGIVAFTVTVNEREAMLWLRENRNELWAELYYLKEEYETVRHRRKMRPELAQVLRRMEAEAEAETVCG